MAAPKEVLELVDRFERNRESYQAQHYNETQVRREFIDPLFKALGWDIDNELGHAEAYKDVVHEDAIKVGAPDYGFRIGGRRIFFLEAKKPSVKLKDDPDPAFQLRRYAWSAKLPLSILTDFEEFAVYDCRVRPTKDDKAKDARIKYFTFDKYSDEWDWLYSIFSRDAVLKGSFDKYADEKRLKRGTAEVDSAFLEEIESWRQQLAGNITIRNPALGSREVNFAVQRIIDRIVFLRMSEDRGVEPYGRLQALVNGTNIYDRMTELFRRADERYNSGLFHFESERGRAEDPDELTLGLTIDDKPLKAILKSLYYPECPYEFSVLPAEILGQVYEQFLGKVVRVTLGRHIKVEEKPEVRKAGGVYYTPAYIVDYIVKQTVGKLVEGKTPKDVAKLRILDPACGSGSFLVGAYQFLIDWHRDWYFNDGPEKHRKEIYQGAGGAWLLTASIKKQILLNNVYGVDIDSQAVEVTKLSLLLKVLEHETGESIDRQLRLLHERALPDLGKNIKCGNSLIGTDFYANRQMSLLDEEEQYRINAFDWKDEFPEIFKGKNHGFDAVIGNPPYVLLQSLGLPQVFEYLSHSYGSAKYKVDTYHVFMEKSLVLCAPGGYVGLITPNSFLRNKHAVDLRRLLLAKSAIVLIQLHEFPVFRGASVDTCVTIVQRLLAIPKSHKVIFFRLLSPNDRMRLGQCLQSEWMQRDDLNFDPPGNQATQRLIAKIKKHSRPLGAFATAYFGIQTHDRERFVDRNAKGVNWKPAIDGANISRYSVSEPLEWVNTDSKAIKSGGKLRVYENPRIGVRQIGQTPVATLLPGGWYSLNTIYNIFFTAPTKYDLRFVLGVISSRSIRWLWLNLFYDQKRTFPKIKKAPLLELPVFSLDLCNSDDKARHDRIVSAVQLMIELKRDEKKRMTDQHRTILRRRIEATDREIDRLVYELYELTVDEIEMVESETK